MTRSNIHIKLSDGSNIQCVCDSSSAPEQGYFVEHLLLPLLACNDADKELEILGRACAMYEQRTNADYRYIMINGKVTRTTPPNYLQLIEALRNLMARKSKMYWKCFLKQFQGSKIKIGNELIVSS